MDTWPVGLTSYVLETKVVHYAWVPYMPFILDSAAIKP